MNHRQGGIRLASFKTAHVGTKKAAALRQVFLGKAGGDPQGTDPFSKQALHRFAHRVTVRKVHLFIHTLIRTFASSQEARRGQFARQGSDKVNRRLPTVVLAATLMSCATQKGEPLPLPAPPTSLIEAHAGDYERFSSAWMGGLPTKAFARPFPTMPSDARLLPITQVETRERQFQVLLATFTKWCAASGGISQARDDDMTSAGRTFAVCEGKSDKERLGALRIYLDPDATRAGRQEYLVQHWYRADIARYIREYKEVSASNHAAREQARRGRLLREESERADRIARDTALLDRFATAARSKPATSCKRFERESNAVLARFTVAMERSDLRRFISDLAVALDECIGAKAGPADALAEVYRFNLASFRFFADVWDANMLRCESTGRCSINGRPSLLDQRELARMQADYPALRLSPPERFEDILNRVQRFVLDRS